MGVMFTDEDQWLEEFDSSYDKRCQGCEASWVLYYLLHGSQMVNKRAGCNSAFCIASAGLFTGLSLQSIHI